MFNILLSIASQFISDINFSDYDNVWDWTMGPYVAVVGAWVYYIIIAAISFALYIKNNNITYAAVLFTVLALVIAPFVSQIPQGEYVVYITLVFGGSIAIAGLFIKRWNYGG